MIIPYITSLVRDAGDRDKGIKDAFRYLEALKMKPKELEDAKSETVRIADTIYTDCCTE